MSQDGKGRRKRRRQHRSSKKWDAFISHASEDKASFVRPLAESLTHLGAKIWYDELTLKPGCSLSESIDRGLANSRHGLVVLSRHFIQKPWPKRELRGLVTREVGEGLLIIPIWHGISKSELVAFSPPLADTIALRTEDSSAEDIAIQILRQIRPDLYKKHPRAHLQHLASGEALNDLQKELNRAREQLSEYRCQHCGARVSERMAYSRPEYDGFRETYECGYETRDGVIDRPCPFDPAFPKFAEYHMEFHQTDSNRWLCVPIPQTHMAKKLHISPGTGATKEEAEQRVRSNYERNAEKRPKPSD